MSALAEALVAAQAELPCAIQRDAQGDGYKYTTLDKLIEATRPILATHGLSITQWPTTIPRGEDGMIPGLTTRITHSEAITNTFGFSEQTRVTRARSARCAQVSGMGYTQRQHATILLRDLREKGGYSDGARIATALAHAVLAVSDEVRATIERHER